MKIVITHPTAADAAYNAEAVERLLRIAFTRYASILKQISLQVDKTACPGSGAGYKVHIRMCVGRQPDVEVEEVQTMLGLAIDRAIHRADGLIRHHARNKARSHT
jgi:hypothetical protein